MDGVVAQHPDSGLRALCGIAAFFRIASDPIQLNHDLALRGRAASTVDLQRAAKIIGLKARLIERVKEDRLRLMPVPAIVRVKSGAYEVLGGLNASGNYRLVDPVTRADREISPSDILDEIGASVILVGRRIGVRVPILASSALNGFSRQYGATVRRSHTFCSRLCSFKFLLL